jgi:hypothetical protein
MLWDFKRNYCSLLQPLQKSLCTVVAERGESPEWECRRLYHYLVHTGYLSSSSRHQSRVCYFRYSWAKSINCVAHKVEYTSASTSRHCPHLSLKALNLRLANSSLHWNKVIYPRIFKVHVKNLCKYTWTKYIFPNAKNVPWQFFIEGCHKMVNDTASYSGDNGFKYGPGNRLSWLRFFVVLLGPSGCWRDSTLKWGKGRLVPILSN